MEETNKNDPLKQICDDMYRKCLDSIENSAKELGIEKFDEDTARLVANELVKLVIYLEARLEDITSRVDVLHSFTAATAAAMSARDPEEAAAETKEITEYINILVQRKRNQNQ